MVQHVAGTGQIEIGMVGEIDRRSLVGGRFIINSEPIVIGERVGHVHGKVTGVTFLAVFAQIGELHRCLALGGWEWLRLPEELRKSLASAMNMVRPCVSR